MKEITITNYSSVYDVSIVSDSGTQFYYDIGNPNLTCLVNGEEENGDDYSYVWAEVDSNDRFTTLNETIDENKEYNDAAAAFEQLSDEVKQEKAGAAASQEKLDEYLTILKKYDRIMRVEKNKIFSLSVKQITNFSTYKCSAYYQGILIGTASIVIYNTLDNADYYNLTLTNGTQVFNYNSSGVSPTNKSLENPMELKPLSFNVYDCLGTLLSDEVMQYCKIQ